MAGLPLPIEDEDRISELPGEVTEDEDRGNGIQELCLSLRFADVNLNLFHLPDCIISCPSIKILSLGTLLLRPLNAGIIFPGVRSLLLTCIKFDPSCAGNTFIVPHLERLICYHCQDTGNFVSSAPELKSLEVIPDISVNEWKWLELHLQVVRTLWFSAAPFMVYPPREVNLPEGFPTARNVEVMKLFGLNFSVPKQFDLAVLLMTKCPKLCELEIVPKEEFIHKDAIEAAAALFPEDPEYGFTEQDLSMLKTVKMHSFLALRLEVLFVKAILMNSPALEKLVIQESPYIDASVASKAAREMSCFARASPKAQVVFLEYKLP